ncbi:hypothetical protein GF394_02120 [Candidatus Fermentibacteria bacterium]|nr:hypothetical protein [Candidatus Fermentibacteria bacterium]
MKKGAGPFPETVRDMFVSGFRSRSERIRKIGLAASVLGNSFERTVLEQVIDHRLPIESDEDTCMDGILFSRGSELCFRHVLVREWISETATDDELALIHRKAGEVMEAQPGATESPALCEAIADHYLMGDCRRKAAGFLELAASARAGSFENSRAEKLYVKLLPLLKGTDRIEAELALADVYKNAGLTPECIEVLRGTLKKANECPDTDDLLRATVQLRFGTALWYSGQLKQAQDLIEMAIPVFRNFGDHEKHAVAVRHLATIIRAAGSTDRAMPLVEESIELARKTRNSSVICASLYWAAIAFRQTGDIERMEELTREQVHLAEEAGLARSIVAGFDNLMRIHIYRRDYERAEVVHDKLKREADRTGNWAALSAASSKMGIVHLRKGEIDQAADCFERCIELTDRTGNLRARCAALGNASHAHILKGELSTAMQYSTRLIDTASEIGYRSGLMSGYARMGYIFKMKGDTGSALDCFRTQIEHAEYLRDIRNLSDGWAAIAEIQIMENCLLESLDSIGRALDHSGRACDMLLYSSQMALQGVILFHLGRLEEAGQSLERSLQEVEGRKGREELELRCRIYLRALNVLDFDKNNGGIPEIDTRDACIENLAELHYILWKTEGNLKSIKRADELARELKPGFVRSLIEREIAEEKI